MYTNFGIQATVTYAVHMLHVVGVGTGPGNSDNIEMIQV